MSEPPQPKAPVVPTTLRGSAVALLMLGGWLALAGSLLGLCGDRVWVLDLFAHFRLQYAVLLLVSGVTALCVRRWWALGVMGAGLVLNAVLLAPLWIGPEPPFSGPGVPLRVLAFNVLTMNTRHDAVTSWVNEQGADVLVMQEVNQRWAEALTAGLPGYQVLPTDTVREDNFGMLVFVRQGLEVAEFEAFTDPAGVPRIEAVVQTQEQRARVIAVHTLPPVGASYSRFRSQQLEEAGRRASASAEPVVLLGDLNASRWSAPFRRLLRDTALRDSAEGFGFAGTWPSGLGWTGMIPIDQALVSPSLRVDDRYVGPALGSDHRAVVVDVSLPIKAVRP